MKATCIIDNYNYGLYLADAVESVLQQTVPFDEVVIVDDGSTDGSRAILQRYASCDSVHVLLKSNGGQMSAFNSGVEVATGDVICFLDSDDVYYPNYLEETLKFYQSNPSCDFAYCGYDRFGGVDERVVDFPHRVDLGITVAQVSARRTFIGGPTSSLSLTRETVQKIMPYPYEDEWRSRADDVLIWGASLVGAHKFFNPQVLVGYRVHTENAWYGKRFTSATKFKRELAVNRLFSHFRETRGYGDRLSDIAYMEFRTHPSPDFDLTKEYLALVASEVPHLWTRLKNYGKIIAHYLGWGRRE